MMGYNSIHIGSLVQLKVSGYRGIVVAQEQSRHPTKYTRYLIHFNDTHRETWHMESEIEQI